jgi:hypothetical protein
VAAVELGTSQIVGPGIVSPELQIEVADIAQEFDGIALVSLAADLPSVQISAEAAELEGIVEAEPIVFLVRNLAEQTPRYEVSPPVVAEYLQVVVVLEGTVEVEPVAVFLVQNLVEETPKHLVFPPEAVAAVEFLQAVVVLQQA